MNYNSLNLYNKLNIKTPYHKWIQRIIVKFDSSQYYFKEVDLIKGKRTYKKKVYFVSDQVKDLIIATKYFKKQNSVPDTLYIVKHTGIENFYKIGVTSNMDRRIRQLNIASPLGIEVIQTFKLGKNALIVENLIHTENKEYRCNGEWFNLTVQQVNDLIAHINAIGLNIAA